MILNLEENKNSDLSLINDLARVKVNSKVNWLEIFLQEFCFIFNQIFENFMIIFDCEYFEKCFDVQSNII